MGIDMNNEWQPIETAPKDGIRVLIVNEDGDIDIASYIEKWAEELEFVRKAKDGDVYRTTKIDVGYFDSGFTFCPTHWMPLPEPPK
jgi:hypothetical protein